VGQEFGIFRHASHPVTGHRYTSPTGSTRWAFTV
jgi:hypothetical protein